MARITKDPEERRQEILDTAMRLFYENGYEKTSISDIAKAMNVAQGLCYRYFPSKEVLFDTAVDQYAQSLVDRMTTVFQQPGLSLKEIIVQMPTFLDTEEDDSFAYKVYHGPERAKLHGQLSMAVCEKLVPIVKEQLDQAADRGELDLDDTEAAASFCVYGQLGILLRTDLEGGERVRRTKAFLLKLLQIT